MDSVRAKSTSLHGHQRDTTPFLRSFAEESTQFLQARSPAPKSLTSHVSMFTGYSVDEHNIAFRDTTIDPTHTIWHKLFDEHGYDTGVFSDNVFLTELNIGLKGAFDHVYSTYQLPYSNGLDPRDYMTKGYPVVHRFIFESIKQGKFSESIINGLAAIPELFKRSTRASHLVDAFLSWQDTRERRWAACVNFMDAHASYSPPGAFDIWSAESDRLLMQTIDHHVWEFQCGNRPVEQLMQLNNLYDGAIRYIDAQIERLITTLRKRINLDDTLIIVTSDHGQAFGEKSRLRPNLHLAGHGEAKIHECVLHVPLLVRCPAQEGGREIHRATSLTEFPEVVEGVLSNSNTDEIFETDRVLATAVGLKPGFISGAEAYCDKLDDFMGRARALYETTPEGVRKYMTWKDRNRTIDIQDVHNTEEIHSENADIRIRRELESLEPIDISGDRAPEIDDDTYERLVDLGYA